jgi:UDP-N-acetylglucosamine 4,6-dehydratase/5-epimerase
MNFRNKVVLITGGTGSFGNAVLKKLLSFDVAEIRIFSRDELKQDNMRKLYKDQRIKFYIGDVRTSSSIDNAMAGVDFVFHAAALKQVPTCEFFPMEAVRTNVFGCENVIDSSIKYDIQKVVILSTDKAVYPINAMGLTKALSEKIMVAKARSINSSKTIICGTRYGNVMASRGSVIPLFINQMIEGHQLTITDPSMTRFMMTLDDAVNLVLFAFENGENGDIFVQKSPSCTVQELANVLIELFDFNSKIKIIGTRHGEKLFETLVNREEMIKAIDLGEYYRIPSDNRDLDYDLYFSDGKDSISDIEEYNSHNTTRLNNEKLKKLLLSIDSVSSALKDKNY